MKAKLDKNPISYIELLNLGGHLRAERQIKAAGTLETKALHKDYLIESSEKNQSSNNSKKKISIAERLSNGR